MDNLSVLRICTCSTGRGDGGYIYWVVVAQCVPVKFKFNCLPSVGFRMLCRSCVDL